MKHLFTLTFLMAFFIAGDLAKARSTPLKQERWNVRDHVPMKKFIMQCHRGAGELFPENTLEAFQLGWKWGAVPEADARTTRDGVIVAFHDNNFKRVVKDASQELQKKGIKDLTMQELSGLEVGSWRGEQFKGQRVPQLKDVFKAMSDRPSRRLYLDFKDVDLTQLAALVKSHKVGKQVTLATPNPDIARQWMTLVPESGTLLWMGGSEEELGKKIDSLRNNNFAGITQLQIHVKYQKDSTSLDSLIPSDTFIINLGNELRDYGILLQALPWRISDPQVFGKLMDLGVMSFATDYPETTRKAISDYYKQKKTKRSSSK